MNNTFVTQSEAPGGPDASYYGDRGNWYIVLSTHPGADTVTQSNFSVAIQRLSGIRGRTPNPGGNLPDLPGLVVDNWAIVDNVQVDNWAIETSGHWLVGRLEKLIVEPGTKAEEIAREIVEQLEDYPLLDEEHHSNLESEKTEELWASWSTYLRVLELGSRGENIFAARAKTAGELLGRGYETFYYEYLQPAANCY